MYELYDRRIVGFKFFSHYLFFLLFRSCKVLRNVLGRFSLFHVTLFLGIDSSCNLSRVLSFQESSMESSMSTFYEKKGLEIKDECKFRISMAVRRCVFPRSRHLAAGFSDKVFLLKWVNKIFWRYV